MRAFEKVLEVAISRLEKQITDLDELINASPGIDLIELKMNVFERCKGLTYKDALVILGEAKEAEKRLMNLMNKQKNMVGLIDKRVKLILDCTELKNELFHYRLRNKIVKL